MPSPPAVRARGLVKRYGPVSAVDGVDLEVELAQVHGLAGPNGAGKTTVLGMLVGLVEPDEGELAVLGRDRATVERGWLEGVAGFVGGPRFYPYLTGRQNLGHLVRLDGDTPRRARARIADALAAVGIADAADARVRGYSLGMRQRLGIAAALLRAPRLLVLDEPANGLDPAGTRDLQALLRDLAAGGTAVLLSSHDLGALEDVCDAVTVLRAGRTVFAGSMAALRTAAPAAAYRLATSDDAAAVRHAGGVRVAELPGGGLAVHAAGPAELDAYTLGLARAGIAVRALRLEAGPLQSLYFRLTQAPAPAPAGPARVPAGAVR
ncbi:MAG: transporter related [Mycobacterium sp.]|nr:transporter related [Mycobacterium sp.]